MSHGRTSSAGGIEALHIECECAPKRSTKCKCASKVNIELPSHRVSVCLSVLHTSLALVMMLVMVMVMVMVMVTFHIPEPNRQ